jgi:hypothetical protein
MTKILFFGMAVIIAAAGASYAVAEGGGNGDGVGELSTKLLEPKMCMSAGKEFSLGAVFRKSDADLRCTSVYIDTESEAIAAWVPLSNSLKSLNEVTKK